MIPAAEALRYDYPDLHKDSVVVDAGAYQGNWSKVIHEKYGCIVLAFEPVKAFFDTACETCKAYRRINLFHCALGGHFRYAEFGVQDDSSGAFAASETRERSPVMPLVPHLRQIYPGRFTLLKLNVEGMEFEIMEHILAEGAATMFDHYQIQWHSCAGADSEQRRAAILDKLSLTHHHAWGNPPETFHDNTWEGWSANTHG